MLELREIPGFPRYRAGSDGHIYRLVSRRSKHHPIKRLGTLSPYDYWQVTLFSEVAKRQALAHIIIAEVFIGPKPSPKHEVLHKNGKRLDNRPCNLRWGTRAENEADKAKHGTKNNGEYNGRAKLTEHQVCAVRNMREKGFTYAAVARSFKISETNARLICQFKTWTD